MRVLYLIDSLAPSGAETSLAALAPHLIAGGVDLEVAYFHERPGVHDRLRAAGATLTHIGDHGGRVGRIARTRAILRDRRPDLLHTTLFEADIAGRTAAKLARTRAVTSLVNDSYGPGHTNAEQLGWRLRAAHVLDATTAQFAVRFHANSHHVASTMRARLHIGRIPIDVVHRGRDAAELGTRTPDRRAAARDALGIDDATPLVLGVGRIEAQKGFDVLVRAMTEVAVSVPGVRCVIAGRDGAASVGLRSQISETGMVERITLLGHRTDPAELFCAADVIAFPSRREGLPGTLIEAMALECPIVATDLPNIREVTGGHAAALVPVEDHRRLAAAVTDVLQGRSGDPATMATARERFFEHFTIEASAAGMLAFYEAALK
jgi:glycosyltransferase involved in cell wall biosynthesis